ncbi:dystroglycan-like [Dorcoceras hygrometricum]|uniref:Dystroglycan-like n=1 Tax=Dorcoceras hygrometricum TaxID=472368 RepID=A0A2Z7CQ47_9LAMI|nr:dystroglycan-like [Dorcoceras hygrometricum]
MASAFISYSYQINFESVLMIHDHEGMVNMFKALEASGLRKFLGCESILYEKELGDFFDTALVQGEDITGVISGKFVTISPTQFSTVFDLPTEGITNFSEVPKDKVYDARSLFSQKGLQIDVHGKKKFMKHEFRLLNDILAKAITVKAGSFDSVTVERFQMMTAVQYGLKVNWGKGIPAIPMGDGVPFPSAKVLSMRTVHTYIVTNTTIDARTESEEPGMAKTPKAMKKLFSADEMPVDMFAEFTASKKRSATAADAPIITKKRRTGKSKPSVSQAKLDIVQVATDVEPIQIVDPTHVEETEDFTKWLDDFVARHNEPELGSSHNEAQAVGSIHSVADKEVNMPIDDLLIQICDDLLLPVTAAEVSMLRLGAFSSSGDKGKAKVGEDDQVTNNAARKLFALICRDVEVLVQVRDRLMQAVVDFFASFSLNSMPDMDSLKDLKEKERLMLAWAETNTLAIAVRRQLYVLTKYHELLLRTVLESYQRYLTHDLPWNAMAIQVANLLSVAHSNSIEELKAQQQELNIDLVQSHSSLPAMDYIDSGDVRLAHFYSIANSCCWVRPVFLINGVWTPVQGPEFWSSSCNLSLFLDNLQMPAPAIQGIFVTHNSFIAPDQYWANVPCLMRIWRWTKVCEEVVAFNLSGGLRPVRKDACYAITVHNLGVERIPANFLRLFARGLASQNFVDSVVKNVSPITVHNLGVERIPANFLRLFARGLASQNFVDSVVKKYLGDTEEVVLTDEEVELVSSDVSTVYRSPSPPSPGVDSLEHDLRFALGPAIFSRTEQEERLYFVQSPNSPPAVSPHHESSSSSTDVSLHFDSTDIPVHAQAATHAPASVDSTKLSEILEDLQSSLSQRIHDSNCEMLSKLNSVELGVRGDLLKMQSLLRQSFETACRVLERQSNTHTAQITDLKKGLMGPVGIIFGDLFEIKKKQREKDAKQQSMDDQIAAIRNEHLEFQSKIAADMLSLSTQVGDIADFLRSGVAKKGEMGSSSRPTTVRAQTQTLPPMTGTFKERVAQARRNIIETGQVISIEEVAARVIENDRRESERLERERRDRRQSRSSTYKRRR